MKKIILLFKNPIYSKLFLANFTSQFGGTIGLTAIMFFFLKEFTDMPSLATLVELFMALPIILVFMLVGVFADNFDRQKIIQNCDWLCGICSLLIVLSLLFKSLIFIFIFIFIRSMIKAFFNPAHSAIIQGILEEDEYPIAVGLNQLISSLFILFGSSIGIGLYLSVGVYSAMIIDALSFFISGILISSCKISYEIKKPNQDKYNIKEIIKFNIILKEFRQGINYIYNHKLLLQLMIGFLVFGILNGSLTVLQLFLLKYKLAPYRYEEISIISGMFFGVGILLGSIFASILSQKIKLQVIFRYSLLLIGCLILICSIIDDYRMFIVTMMFVAFCIPAINISLGGWIPKIVEVAIMGRVQSCITIIMMISQAMTLLLISIIYPNFISVDYMFLIVGSIIIFTFVFYSYILPKH